MSIVAKRRKWGGARPGAGRKPKAADEPRVDAWADSVYLSREEWEFLSTYLPNGNPSEQLREALDMLRRFQPGGAGTTRAMAPETVERVRKTTHFPDLVEQRRLGNRGR